MKSNKIIRLGFILFILTMISACTLSGTLAIYTTSDSSYDVAYIAQWGIDVAVTGQTYTVDGVTYEQSMMYTSDENVSMTSDVTLIAPNSYGYYTFGWSGTPEVAVTITAATWAEEEVQEGQGILNLLGSATNDVGSTVISQSTSLSTGTMVSSMIVGNNDETDEEEIEYYYSAYMGSWYGADGLEYYPIEWGLFQLDDSTVVDDLYDDSYFYSEDNLVGDYYSSAICNVENTAENLSYNNENLDDDTLYTQTNFATDYESFCNTINNIYFLYEAGETIDNQFVVLWRWEANSDDATACANDTYISNLTQYDLDYFLVIGAYSVGDIIANTCYVADGTTSDAYIITSLDNVADATGYAVGDIMTYSELPDGCKNVDGAYEHAYIITSTNKYSNYAVGDIVSSTEYYSICYYEGCLASPAEIVTAIGAENSYSVGDILTYAEYLEAVQSGYSVSVIQIYRPYLEIALTVTVSQYTGRDSGMAEEMM